MNIAKVHEADEAIQKLVGQASQDRQMLSSATVLINSRTTLDMRLNA